MTSSKLFVILAVSVLFVDATSDLSKEKRISIVLNGKKYPSVISDNDTSLMSAINAVIKNAPLYVDDLTSEPDFWNVYLGGNCIKSYLLAPADAQAEYQVNLAENDTIYVFRNNDGILNPLYVAEQLKSFSKKFGKVFKDVNQKSKNKKQKKKNQSPELANVVNTFLRYGLLGQTGEGNVKSKADGDSKIKNESVIADDLSPENNPDFGSLFINIAQQFIQGPREKKVENKDKEL